MIISEEGFHCSRCDRGCLELTGDFGRRESIRPGKNENTKVRENEKCVSSTTCFLPAFITRRSFSTAVLTADKVCLLPENFISSN